MLRYIERHRANTPTNLWKAYHRNSNRSIEMNTQGVVPPLGQQWRFWRGLDNDIPGWGYERYGYSLLPFFERIIVDLQFPSPPDYETYAKLIRVNRLSETELDSLLVGASDEVVSTVRNLHGYGTTISTSTSSAQIKCHKFGWFGYATHDVVDLDSPGYIPSEIRSNFGLSGNGSKLGVYFPQQTPYDPDFTGAIYCYNTSDGSVDWSYDFPPDASVSEQAADTVNISEDGTKILTSSSWSDPMTLRMYDSSGLLDSIDLTDIDYANNFENNISMINDDKIVVSWHEVTQIGSKKKVDIAYKILDFSTGSFVLGTKKTIKTNWLTQEGVTNGYGLVTGNVWESRVLMRPAVSSVMNSTSFPLLVDFGPEPPELEYVTGRPGDDSVAHNSMTSTAHYFYTRASGLVSSTNKYIYTNTDKAITSDARVDLRADELGSYPGTGSSWVDLSDYGNDATLSGSYSYLSDANGALSFTGGYAQIPANFYDPGTGEFTVEAWVRRDTNYVGLNANVIFVSQSSNSQGMFNLVVNYFNSPPYYIPNRFGVSTYEGPSEVILPTTRPSKLHQRVVKLGVWYHVVGTRDYSGNLEIYVNGVRSNMNDDYSVSHVSLTSNDPRVAINPASGLETWPGSVSELRVYDYAMSRQDIQYMFNIKKNQYGY